MAFVAVLRPGERLLINGAEILVRNNVKIELQNNARFMFGRQIMNPEEATTLGRQIYLALQNTYVGASEKRDQHRDELLQLSGQFLKENPSASMAVDSMLDRVRQNEMHQALRLARILIKHEDGIAISQPSPSATRPTRTEQQSVSHVEIRDAGASRPLKRPEAGCRFGAAY